MIDNEREPPAVVKAAIPRGLKTEFKVLCARKNLNMSQVLSSEISRWVRNNESDLPSCKRETEEKAEEVKGYISPSLKARFKVVCAQKHLKMKVVICSLIREWIGSNQEVDGEDEATNISLADENGNGCFGI